MAEVILMPRLSDTMTEGVIAAWHKKVGDKVKKGDLLAEIDARRVADPRDLRRSLAQRVDRIRFVDLLVELAGLVGGDALEDGTRGRNV